MQIVEIVLHFAVGQFAVDQVAGAVVAVAGKGMRIGKGRLKVISDDLIRLLGLDPTYSH